MSMRRRSPLSSVDPLHLDPIQLCTPNYHKACFLFFSFSFALTQKNTNFLIRGFGMALVQLMPSTRRRYGIQLESIRYLSEPV